MSDSAAQLQELVGMPRILEIRGKRIELRPPRPFTDEFVKILRLLAPMQADFASETVDVADLLMKHGERVRPLCGLLANVEEEWLKTLEIEEAVQLVQALVEENLDFFARRVVPVLGSALSALIGKWSTMNPTTPLADQTQAASAGPTPPSS
jgi:hypothetical protein